MAEYEFETVEGRVPFTAEFPLGKAPSVGEEAVIDGVKCVRVFHDHQIRGAKDNGFASVQIHPHHPALKGVPRNKKGWPVFSSPKEAQKLCERSQKLAETVNPNIPAYAVGAMSDTSQTDRNAADATLMAQQKAKRQIAGLRRKFWNIFRKRGFLGYEIEPLAI